MPSAQIEAASGAVKRKPEASSARGTARWEAPSSSASIPPMLPVLPPAPALPARQQPVEVAVAQRLGRGQVDRPVDVVALDGPQESGGGILQGDPRLPLVTAAQPGPRPDPVGGAEDPAQPARGADHQARAGLDRAQPGLRRRARNGLPAPAQLGQESLTRAAGLGEDLVAPVPVEAGGRSAQQDLGPPGRGQARGDPGDEGGGGQA